MPAGFRLGGNILSRNVNNDEEIYAARVGRAMWRAAKRRAGELRYHELISAGKGGADPVTAIENKAAPPTLRPCLRQRQAAANPQTLAEFLQLLAAELASDDQDPGAS